MNTPKMLAQKFLTNLEIRISKAVLEMNAIEGILDEFHKNKELNAQFDAKTKKPLTLCLKDLQKAIVPTSNMLEKTIKNWGSG